MHAGAGGGKALCGDVTDSTISSPRLALPCLLLSSSSSRRTTTLYFTDAAGWRRRRRILAPQHTHRQLPPRTHNIHTPLDHSLLACGRVSSTGTQAALVKTHKLYDELQRLNYSARDGGSLYRRGLNGRSWSLKDREQRWNSRPPTRDFRAFKALC